MSWRSTPSPPMRFRSSADRRGFRRLSGCALGQGGAAGAHLEPLHRSGAGAGGHGQARPSRRGPRGHAAGQHGLTASVMGRCCRATRAADAARRARRRSVGKLNADAGRGPGPTIMPRSYRMSAGNNLVGKTHAMTQTDHRRHHHRRSERQNPAHPFLSAFVAPGCRHHRRRRDRARSQRLVQLRAARRCEPDP